jgi:hypothetical protein
VLLPSPDQKQVTQTERAGQPVKTRGMKGRARAFDAIAESSRRLPPRRPGDPGPAAPREPCEDDMLIHREQMVLETSSFWSRAPQDDTIPEAPPASSVPDVYCTAGA